MNHLSEHLPELGKSNKFMLRGPAGWLECLLEQPARPAVGAALICHPHPLYGGAMSNKVTYTLAKTAVAAGYLSLRFNFRGVGKSEGVHDQGLGETADAIALGQALRAATVEANPLVLAGFSFGSFIALNAAATLHPAALMSVAPPFAKYFGSLPNPVHPRCLWAALHSKDDAVVGYDSACAAMAAYQPPPDLTSVDGAGHFFHGRLDDVAQCFAALLQRIP